jgi:HTH-type transcriptional regulator/antitoxin HigA
MKTTSKLDDIFPPGEYLRDELEERGWTEKEFAEILGRPVQAVSEILNGRKQVTPETALSLADALGTSPEVWLNLQAAYNLSEAKAKRSPGSEVSRRSRIRSLVPIAELRRRGWLPDTNDIDVLEASVKELVGISDLSHDPQFIVAARRSNAAASFSAQQIAWLARLRQIARHRTVPTYTAASVEALSSDLVHRIHDPTDLGKLSSWLADIGVILATLLPLTSSKLDGAVMLDDGGNPVIGLTSRGDRMDSYVFTLLHELAHLHLGHLQAGGIRTDEDITIASCLDDVEDAANRQAAKWILPEDTQLPSGRPSMATILQVANRHRIHASFVIGRIQRDRQDWGLLRRSIPRVRPNIAAES